MNAEGDTMKHARLIGLLLLMAGIGIGLVAPTSAQQVVRLYGTLSGTPGTPIALTATSDGYLQVVCTNIEP
jgi:hypothetical protein